MTGGDVTNQSRIHGLDDLLRAARNVGDAPVERWNPPYCGDIGMAIAADGTWLYRNSPIRRIRLTKLFARVLRRDEDGRYFLVTPAEKVDVAVADAPFIAVEMDVTGSGRSQSLRFRTNLDDLVVCGPEHPLRFSEAAIGGGLKPYVRVRGRLEALIARAVVYDLVDLIESDGQAAPGVWSGGRFFPVGAA